MIDGIGPTGTGRIETNRTGGAGRAAAAPLRTAGEAPAPANPVADLVATGAPVDMAKVESVRAAIAEGRYTVDPKAIADKMLALDLPARG